MQGSKKIVTVLMVLLICLASAGGAAASSDTIPDTVRIGLKTYYEDKGAITIYNDTMVMGYNMKDGWVDETTLSYGSPFVFKPLNGVFVISETNFESLGQAGEIADQLRLQGYPAYPGIVGFKTWKVYIGSCTQQEAKEVQSNVEGFKELHFTINGANGSRIEVSNNEGRIFVIDSGYQYPQFMAGNGVALDLGDRKYRGKIEFSRCSGSGVTVINELPLEEYLYGVVPAEMITWWPMESLKAQAVAARNFAIYNMITVRKYPNMPYDLCDTVNSQVYKGYGYEDPRTNQAVDETKGKLVYYKGEIIPTYFFSTSGGYTESSEDVWSGTVAYLKAKPDPYEIPEKQPWIETLSKAELGDILRERGESIGTVQDIVIDNYTNSASGRVACITIKGSGGKVSLTKETMRYWLGLYSRKFQIVKGQSAPQITVVNGDGKVAQNLSLAAAQVIGGDRKLQTVRNEEQVITRSVDNLLNYPLVSSSSDSIIFAGMGNGHGVGMSQSGARGMAEAGYTYDQILMYYYTGTVVK